MPRDATGGTLPARAALMQEDRELRCAVGRLTGIELKLRRRQAWLEQRVHELELANGELLAEARRVRRQRG